PGVVLLLDLDFPYSHSALLAGLVPTSCLARTASVPQESFEDVLLSTVLYDSGGPMILPGALRPEEADEVTPELVNKAIATLRKTFRYIVVDLGVTITDSTLALFDLTQHVVLIAAPQLSAVKSAADAVENGKADTAYSPGDEPRVDGAGGIEELTNEVNPDSIPLQHLVVPLNNSGAVDRMDEGLEAKSAHHRAAGARAIRALLIDKAV